MIKSFILVGENAGKRTQIRIKNYPWKHKKKF